MILNPENNINILKYYHSSSKLLLPLCGMSYLLHNYESKYTKILDNINILNIGFHSYVSTSSVIGDYIKGQNIQKIAKFVNFKSHMVACVGFLYYVNYKNKK